MPEGVSLMQIVVDWAFRILGALIVFAIGGIVVRWIVNFARRQMGNRKVDLLIINFVSNILNWSLLLVVLIIALNQLGVDTTAMIALLGAAGLAVGLALQDSMKNFASGVLLIIFRPFSTGHFVEAAGTSGTVESITLFTSTLLTGDNCEVIVPNSAIFSSNITNSSVRPTRRVDLIFAVSYEDDLRKARDLLQQIVTSDPRILADPAPVIVVGELAGSSVNFYVRPWVNNDDYWGVKFDMLEKVKLAFDDHGFTIPYSQMEVHVQNSEVQIPEKQIPEVNGATTLS